MTSSRTPVSLSRTVRMVRTPPHHAVAGVERQVDEHLLDLRWIDLDERIGCEVELQANVRPDERAEERLDALDDRGQVDVLWEQNLLAAEREQLVRQLGRPSRCAADLVRVVSDVCA